jgi:hypothetical protein
MMAPPDPAKSLPNRPGMAMEIRHFRILRIIAGIDASSAMPRPVSMGVRQ